MSVNDQMIVQAPPGTLFDIGANHGLFTIAMGVGTHRVYAFEPDPDNLIILRSRTDGLSTVTIVPTALGNYVGETRLWSGRLNPGGSTTSPAVGIDSQWGHAPDPIMVPITTIDAFVAEHQITDLVGLKIDVEGSEQQVLEGAYQTLRDFNLLIALETHSRVDMAAVHQLLIDAGYGAFTDAEPGNTPVEIMDMDHAYFCRKLHV
jgi:FkbM family methyltransferase